VKLACSRLLGTATLLACAPSRQVVAPVLPAPRTPVTQSIIPAPASVQLVPDQQFVLSDSTTVVYSTDAAADAARVADYLATMLSPTVVRTTRGLTPSDPTPRGALRITLNARATSLGDEGYALTVTRDSVVLTAREAAGLFHGVQSIRQLLPVSVEHPAAMQRRLVLPGIRIVDAPRFAWRGAMLDVSRHFLAVDDVKHFIDGMALYKFNRLHLHLSDDQGWRLEIKSWPTLAQVGGRSEVGGGVGGFYTQAQYSDLVAYARDRYITVVPEIEMPGHSNAALSAVAQLNCDGIATDPYTGIKVGFSTFCASSDTVFAILNDVIREVAALTPGEFIHIGGDEVEKLGHAQYLRFVERAEKMVRLHGKRMIGWGEIAPATLDPSTVVQHWRYREGKSEDSAYLHAARGGMIIASPGAKTYLDMKYDAATVLGLRWAGLIGVRDAYEWEPATLMTGVAERFVLGVEAPLWSETLEKRADFEFMAFPRLLAIAEIGWTPRAQRGWEDFRMRLAEHGPRLQALGVNFYRAPDVPWR
jgi:hexosaminidase